MTAEAALMTRLEADDQIALRYHADDNFNGSTDRIAGICDATGRVLGLMPHPARHIFPTQHPQWNRSGLKEEGEGLPLFRNAVEFFKQD